MENMMRKYIGYENYSYTNHVRNFCLYWIKASKGCGDEWRKENDLDCLYFNGDLRADTLMSAWTPVKWVADYLNKDKHKKFYKRLKNSSNPCKDLELLAENCDKYLPPAHPLVVLLEEFLTLAEKRCNYILLPDRNMNCERYHMDIDGKEIWLYDSVPATLYHVFNEKTLGRYFTDISPETWIKREHLSMGFINNIIAQDKIISMPGYDGYGNAKWLDDEDSIREALGYMIAFLKIRNYEVYDYPALETLYRKLVEKENSFFSIEFNEGKDKMMKKVYASNIRRELERVFEGFIYSDMVLDDIWEERLLFDINYLNNDGNVTDTCIIRVNPARAQELTVDELLKENKIDIDWNQN